MGTQQQLTEDQITVLIWLKALDDFKEGSFAKSEFSEKYRAFEAVEDTGYSREEFESSVEFWVKNNVLEENEDEELSISKQGKKLFKLLEDEQNAKIISDFLNSNPNGIDIEEIKEWVKANYPNIIAALGLCLQLADFVLTHFN